MLLFLYYDNMLDLFLQQITKTFTNYVKISIFKMYGSNLGCQYIVL